MSIRSIACGLVALPLAFAAPQGSRWWETVDETATTASASVSATPSLPPLDLENAAINNGDTPDAETDNTDDEPTVTAAATAADDTVAASFSASKIWDFGAGDPLPDELFPSNWDSGGSPLVHTYTPDNVYVEDGFLVLMVPGGQEGSPTISGGEIATTFNMTSASVRTHAILTEEPGVCNGIYFYLSDSQETDIEWISDPRSTSNIGANNGSRALMYTNQDTEGVFENKHTLYGRAPDDATSAVHEYRLDWFPEYTEFYLDGVFHQRITEDVPYVKGPWLWNNWVDGNPDWTLGPPENDAPFKIQKIEMYYTPA